MEEKIRHIEDEYEQSVQIQDDVHKVFNSIKHKITRMNKLYKNIVKKNSNKLFLFGIDSFQFQFKLIQEDFKHDTNKYHLLNNRVYHNYYKLYRIIIDFINEYNKNKLDKIKYTTNNSYPKYNHINIYKNYDNKLNAQLFREICNLIRLLNDHLKLNQSKITSYYKTQNLGVDIDNFIYTIEFENNNLEEKIDLILKYLEYFLNIHKKYYDKFIKNITLTNHLLDKEVHFKSKSYKKSKSSKPHKKTKPSKPDPPSKKKCNKDISGNET